MNPYTNTREEFTSHLLSLPIPESAAADWKDVANKLRPLLEKLAYHDAMAPNLQQTYMTPAADKNKVYFMWDFVGRTLGILYSVNPALPKNMGRQEKERWTDAEGRPRLAKELILDTKKGMLNQMTESTYPDQRGKHPEFGEEILALAREL